MQPESIFGKPPKHEKIHSIMENIFGEKDVLIPEDRKKSITDFVTSTVNGDNPVDNLVIGANFDENNVGILAYILTNRRLIKIDIDSKEIKSNSFPLNTLIGIERRLEGGREQFTVNFQNGGLGLRYPQDNQKITNFFQKIDQRGGDVREEESL